MYNLKVDPKLPYHYFISVGVRSMKNSNPGKMFLKHGPLKFTNNDVKNMQDASLMTRDKLFPTSNKEAIKMFGVGDLTHSIWAMQMAASANDCTIHHFSSDCEFPDDFWEGFVDRANTNQFEKEKIFGARIRAGGFV